MSSISKIDNGQGQLQPPTANKEGTQSIAEYVTADEQDHSQQPPANLIEGTHYRAEDDTADEQDHAQQPIQRT